VTNLTAHSPLEQGPRLSADRHKPTLSFSEVLKILTLTPLPPVLQITSDPIYTTTDHLELGIFKSRLTRIKHSHVHNHDVSYHTIFHRSQDALLGGG
jgi:hypothetical protein